MTTAHVTAVMLDGVEHEATGVYMALADRVAFERIYNVSILEMARESRSLSGKDDAPVPELREERAAYFAWRLLDRASAGVGDFDHFLENADELRIEVIAKPVDPTEPVPESGT